MSTTKGPLIRLMLTVAHIIPEAVAPRSSISNSLRTSSSELPIKSIPILRPRGLGTHIIQT